jgi:hypothetical protein
VEIPAPPVVRCAKHASVAELIQMPNGQVRYTPRRAVSQDKAAPEPNVDVVKRL